MSCRDPFKTDYVMYVVRVLLKNFWWLLWAVLFTDGKLFGNHTTPSIFFYSNLRFLTWKTFILTCTFWNQEPDFFNGNFSMLDFFLEQNVNENVFNLAKRWPQNISQWTLLYDRQTEDKLTLKNSHYIKKFYLILYQCHICFSDARKGECMLNVPNRKTVVH